MRIAVLILAVLGALGPGGLGLVGEYFRHTEKTTAEKNVEFLERVGNPGGKINIDRVNAEYQIAQRANQAVWFLIAALPLGIIGGVLAFLGRGIGAGLLMLVASLGPGLLAPHPLNLLAFGASSILFVAALLAFFVRPPAAAPARKRPDFDDDDVEDHAPPSRKRPRYEEEDEEEMAPRSRRRRIEDEDDEEDEEDQPRRPPSRKARRGN
jgi:hypothetical protein